MDAHTFGQCVVVRKELSISEKMLTTKKTMEKNKNEEENRA